MGDSNRVMPCPNTIVTKSGSCFTRIQKQRLIQEVTKEKIDAAIKDMPMDKAPWVDGYSQLSFIKG